MFSVLLFCFLYFYRPYGPVNNWVTQTREKNSGIKKEKKEGRKMLATKIKLDDIGFYV